MYMSMSVCVHDGCLCCGYISVYMCDMYVPVCMGISVRVSVYVHVYVLYVCACVCESQCVLHVCGLVHGRWGRVVIFSLLLPYLITFKPTPRPHLGGSPRSRTQPWRGEVLSYL